MLSAPKQVTFLLAVLIFVVGLLAQFGGMNTGGFEAIWLVVVAFVILALGTLLRGL